MVNTKSYLEKKANISYLEQNIANVNRRLDINHSVLFRIPGRKKRPAEPWQYIINFTKSCHIWKILNNGKMP